MKTSFTLAENQETERALAAIWHNLRAMRQFRKHETDPWAREFMNERIAHWEIELENFLGGSVPN